MFKKSLFIILSFIFSMFWVVPAMAVPSFLSSDSGVVNVTSPISDDTYISGSHIIVDRDINGDLFVGGGDVDIRGNVAGDLIIIGIGSVLVRGNVADDLRVGAADVLIEGKIGDDVLAGAGTLTISKSAVIGGDLISASGDILLSGQVLGNVKTKFNKGIINGTINGYANLKYDNGLEFGDNAKILGKLTYWAPAQSSNFEEVASLVEYRKWSSNRWSSSSMPIIGALGLLAPSIAFGALVVKYLSILLLGGLLILFLPKYMPRIVGLVKKDYWSVFWQGLAFVIFVPILSILIILTVVGFPISLVLMFSYTILLIIAQAVASLVIGSYFIKSNKKSKRRQFTGLAVGTAVYVLLIMVPFVGWFIKLLFVVLAVGAIWKDGYTMVKAGKY